MKAGDPLILFLSLWDKKDDKHVKVTLRGDNQEIPMSPITLDNLGDGNYGLLDFNSLVFPEDTFEVRAQYEVYSDAAFTHRLIKYITTEDIYRYTYNSEFADIEDKLNNILSVISAADLGDNIKMVVNDVQDMVAQIEETQIEEITGVIVGDSVTAVVTDDEEVSISTDEEEVIGTIQEN